MQNMRFSLREATKKDYGQLCEVFKEGDSIHREVLPHIFKKPDGPGRTREFISSIISSEDAALFVADRDGKIIGLLYLCIQETPAIPIMVPRRYAHIHDLIVREKYRCSGVGRSLLDRTQQWTLDKEASEVQLNVWDFNKGAIAFYEKLGYTIATHKMWKSLE